MKFLVGQGAGARDDADSPGLVDVARHDADLALAGRDHAGAVRPDQAHAELIALHLALQHVERRHTFGDAHDQANAGVRGLEDGVLAERGRHVDHRGIGAGLGHRGADGVEHRQSEMGLAALAGGHAADHAGTVLDRLL